jgi:predicted O-methyltransferase YrrM
MRATHLRYAIARTPLAPMTAFPKRLARVARHDARVLGVSARWLFSSREHHNYTYDITALSREHLAWYVAAVCDASVQRVRGYLTEIEKDEQLRCNLEGAIAGAARRGLADSQVRYGRRIGWYAIARCRRPAHIVETGVDKGLGSCVLAAALLRNADEGAPGRVTSIDINPEAGYLTKVQPYARVIDLVIGDSIAAIAALKTPIDMFLHDSDHSVEHERNEFTAVEPKLSPGALLLSDNVTKTNVLPRYAEKTDRRFLAYRETPKTHWFPGDGIGAAWQARA